MLNIIKTLLIIFIGIFILPLFSKIVSAQTLPPVILMQESFENNLQNWNTFTPSGCSIRISNFAEHQTYNTPLSPDGGNDILISREAGNFNCYTTYFPPIPIQSWGYISL